MPNLIEQVSDRDVPILHELHALVCRTIDEEAGGDDAKRLRLQQALCALIADALAGTCGHRLTYDPRFIAEFVNPPFRRR